MTHVTAVSVSKNAKIGMVAATYVSQESCPEACPLRNSGCYAEAGNTAFVTRRLNAAGPATPEAIAQEEADAIDALGAQLPLRLHVVGDCATEEAARIVAKACARYTARRGQPVWTYTHAWRTVPRAAWGAVSVLASCETPGQVRAAQARGYATALVVAEHASERASDGIIPCPNQTRGTTCDDCRLCFNADKLAARGATIAFAAHGAGAKRARNALLAQVEA